MHYGGLLLNDFLTQEYHNIDYRDLIAHWPKYRDDFQSALFQHTTDNMYGRPVWEHHDYNTRVQDLLSFARDVQPYGIDDHQYLWQTTFILDMLMDLFRRTGYNPSLGDLLDQVDRTHDDECDFSNKDSHKETYGGASDLHDTQRSLRKAMLSMRLDNQKAQGLGFGREIFAGGEMEEDYSNKVQGDKTMNPGDTLQNSRGSSYDKHVRFPYMIFSKANKKGKEHVNPRQ